MYEVLFVWLLVWVIEKLEFNVAGTAKTEIKIDKKIGSKIEINILFFIFLLTASIDYIYISIRVFCQYKWHY